MKTKLFKILFTILFIAFTIGGLLFLYNENKVKTKSVLFLYNENKIKTRAVFSWKRDEVLERRDELFKTMKDSKINTVYQQFSRKLTQENIENFLIEAQKQDIEVSLLNGEAEWALDKEGSRMIETIERVNKINENLSELYKIKSIVFDVEPYLLEEWNDESQEAIMDGFVLGAKYMYKKAKESDLDIILCIPYFYDNMGLSNQLEELIRDGSDSIGIMNYLKDKEVDNIKQEIELADKHGKEVINIYELQAPGKYGLEEKNTYYNDGIKSVEDNFKNLTKEFRGKNLSIAFHEYQSLKELLDDKE